MSVFKDSTLAEVLHHLQVSTVERLYVAFVSSCPTFTCITGWAFASYISDIRGTFPSSEELAHLWENYAQRFVVLIDLVARLLRAQTVWSRPFSSSVRCGLWCYLFESLTPSVECSLRNMVGWLWWYITQWSLVTINTSDEEQFHNDHVKLRQKSA